MASIPVTVGTRTFPSRKAASDAVRDIIARNSVDNVPLAGADLEFAADLLELHPQCDLKTHNGCVAIVVATAEGYSTRCLAAVDIDGNLEEFSFNVSLGIKPCEPVFEQAARNAVSERIRGFKMDAFAGGGATCATSGVPIAFDEAHVDHAPPWTFDQIVRAFRAANPVTPICHTNTRDHFEHDVHAEAFLAFHDERAQLRIVHRKENLSTLRRHGSAKDTR